MAKPNQILEDRLNNGEPLNRKMEALIDLMIAGDPNEPEEGPIDAYGAAKIIGYTRKAVRAMLDNPNFIAGYEEKKRLFLRDKFLTTLQPTAEHLRDQVAKGTRRDARAACRGAATAEGGPVGTDGRARGTGRFAERSNGRCLISFAGARI